MLSGAVYSLRGLFGLDSVWDLLRISTNAVPTDIIAELPLPQSGILAYEENVPYPNQYLASLCGFNPRALSSFSAHLYLRKNLNQVHRMLFDPNRSQEDLFLQLPLLNAEFNIVNHVEETLDMRFVPSEFKFGLDDPPARDILSAQLRAHYWGALVITFRPFIQQILHFNEQRTEFSQAPISDNFKAEIDVPVIDPEATTEGIDPGLLNMPEKEFKP